VESDVNPITGWQVAAFEEGLSLPQVLLLLYRPTVWLQQLSGFREGDLGKGDACRPGSQPGDAGLQTNGSRVSGFTHFGDWNGWILAFKKPELGVAHRFFN